MRAIATEDCADARRELALATGIAPSHCEAELRDLGCYPPLAYPDAERAAAEVAQDLQEIFSDCPDFPGSRMRVDCSEFPCLVAIEREALSLGCDSTQSFAAVAQPAEEMADQFGPRWSDWALFSTVDMPDPDGPLASLAHARYEARVGLLGRTLLRPRPYGGEPSVQPTVVVEPPCEDVHHALAIVRDDRPCDALAHTWGCPDQPPRELDPTHVQAHEEAAHTLVEELEENCPSFAASPTFEVDCSSMPCILGFIKSDQGAWWTDLLCSQAPVHRAHHIHVREEDPGVTILPLWDEDLQSDPSFQARWAIEQDMRRWKLAEKLLEVN